MLQCLRSVPLHIRLCTHVGSPEEYSAGQQGPCCGRRRRLRPVVNSCRQRVPAVRRLPTQVKSSLVSGFYCLLEPKCLNYSTQRLSSQDSMARFPYLAVWLVRTLYLVIVLFIVIGFINILFVPGLKSCVLSFTSF